MHNAKGVIGTLMCYVSVNCRMTNNRGVCRAQDVCALCYREIWFLVFDAEDTLHMPQV